MALVRLTPAVQADIRAARAWLRQPGSGRRAAERLAEIEAAIADLRVHPTRWPVGDHSGRRERSVSGYRLIYRIEEQNARAVVVVLRLFGPGQDRGGR